MIHPTIAIMNEEQIRWIEKLMKEYISFLSEDFLEFYLRVSSSNQKDRFYEGQFISSRKGNNFAIVSF